MTKIRKIDWVICAAGSGTRFKAFGINTPKAKIKLNGSSFLERSISCLEIFPGDQVILIVQKEQQIKELFNKVKKLYPWAQFKIIELKKETTGQLTTFLKSKKYLRKNASLVIWNCDTYFKSINLTPMIRSTKFDGVVPCGQLPGKHWSFFKTDTNGLIIDAKEKERISKWCSVGFYHFKNSTQIVKLAETLSNKKPDTRLKEHYVSSLYPYLIKANKKFINCPVDIFLPFGTPKEVKKYWNISLAKLKKENLNFYD